MLTRERNSSSHASENLPAMRTPRNHSVFLFNTTGAPKRSVTFFTFAVWGGDSCRKFDILQQFYQIPLLSFPQHIYSLYRKYIPHARKKTFALSQINKNKTERSLFSLLCRTRHGPPP